jgi:hypothetical protein
MTIRDLLEMGYSEDTELVIYDKGILYNVYIDPLREGLEKLGVFYHDGLYVDKEY